VVSYQFQGDVFFYNILIYNLKVIVLKGLSFAMEVASVTHKNQLFIQKKPEVVFLFFCVHRKFEIILIILIDEMKVMRSFVVLEIIEFFKDFF